MAYHVCANHPYTPSPLAATRLVLFRVFRGHTLVAGNARLQGALVLGPDRCLFSLRALRIGSAFRVRFTRIGERVLEGEIVCSGDVVAVTVEELLRADGVGDAAAAQQQQRE